MLRSKLAERAGDPWLLAVVDREGGTERKRIMARRRRDLLERGLRSRRALGLQLEWNGARDTCSARRLTRLGETDRARVIWEGLESKALATGDEGSRLMVLWR